MKHAGPRDSESGATLGCTRPATEAPLVDRFGRTHDYMRLSVISACDLRCRYCVTEEGHGSAAERTLKRADYVRIANVATSLGVHRFRVTGGEPLLRKDLVAIIDDLAQLEGVHTLGLTTNGQRLAEKAQALADAGLQHINISLDSLDPERYAHVTRGGTLSETLDGIAAANDAGIKLKLNVVAESGLESDEASRFIERWVVHAPIEVRFLEVMPLSGGAQPFVSLAPLQEQLEQRYQLQPLPEDGGVATRFGRADWRGCLGFIRSITKPFCNTCSRLRVTAWGQLRPCLFSNTSVDLRPALAQPDDKPLREAIRHAVQLKSPGHGLSPTGWTPRETKGLPLIQHTGG